MNITNDEVLEDLVDSGQIEAFLDIIDPQGFDDFCRSVMLTLKGAIESLETNADKYYNLTEEQLSTTISLLIERSGFKTKNEPSNRGHVDIFVEKDDYKWLIEAKIGYNNHKIFEGLLQLTSRYLTNQKSACLLLYFKKRDVKSEFDKWKTFIEKKEWVEYANANNILEDCNFCLNDTKVKSDPTCFGYGFMADVKTTAGEVVDIYHVGANLYYRPFDSSGRDGKALRQEQAKIFLEHLYHARDVKKDAIDMAEVYKALNDFFEFDKPVKDSKKKNQTSTSKSEKSKRAVKKKVA
ncbi:hypothetical protein [Enterobacter hormaechei]|uniref:hypothetical protein n=1 Tax=Enterobacter hormaechei TaxID=158836 RepID=UPI0007967C08|nr:hypothetical protein [Enterobacter hormaechei]SAD71206.1 Uncharacterised protein [Enterobacter hormaechei]SAG59672.1 Uncharacterised protein [Enterobacter hormaechei]SAI02690.1 Uncharacterised protein [Enterobacter hormaechei]